MKKKRGRPTIGERRSVAVTMENEDWFQLDGLLETNQVKLGEYIRNLILSDLNKQGQVDLYKAIRNAQEHSKGAVL